MRWRDPWWARKEIARLDPDRDARRILHLSFEVRYGMPLFVYLLFSLAFARQVAIPDIARVLWRNGKGDIVRETRKRNQDTLLFFGQLFRHGDNAEGQRACEQLRRMHARFPIHNDLNLYTLATLSCEPQRLSERLAGRNVFSAAETRATYVFWRRIGELLDITGIPPDEHALRRWMEEYEAAQYLATPEGAGVVQALTADIADLLPLPRALGAQVFHAAFDERLRAVHGVTLHSAAARRLVPFAARCYLGAPVQWLPDAGERDLISAFGGAYGGDFDLTKVGPARDLPGRKADAS